MHLNVREITFSTIDCSGKGIRDIASKNGLLLKESAGQSRFVVFIQLSTLPRPWCASPLQWRCLTLLRCASCRSVKPLSRRRDGDRPLYTCINELTLTPLGELLVAYARGVGEVLMHSKLFFLRPASFTCIGGRRRCNSFWWRKTVEAFATSRDFGLNVPGRSHV